MIPLRLRHRSVRAGAGYAALPDVLGKVGRIFPDADAPRKTAGDAAICVIVGAMCGTLAPRLRT
jgi:hypothetical protein